MANILDYIYWRGDLSFAQCPLNEIDALILCQLSYIDFSGIGDVGTAGERTLADVAKIFFSSDDYDERKNVGAMINPLTIDLLKKAADSVRFGSLYVCRFVNKIDMSIDEQFSAITFSFPSLDFHFIAYRGTDDTIVGWKEDFNLGYMESVPAQMDALRYFSESANLSGTFALGGHSKGGNLALYAASMAESSLQKRIKCVFNNDGPGFPDDFFKSESYLAIKSVVRSFVPRLSIVGMLFSNSGDYVTVENDLKDMLAQHDPFSWHIGPTGFIECEDIGDESKVICKAVNEWFLTLSIDEKKSFVDTVFHILQGSEVETNQELKDNLLDSFLKMKKVYDDFPPEKLSAVRKNLRLLVKMIFKEFASEVGFPLNVEKLLHSKPSS